MALAPYTVTAVEEDFTTAQSTGKNIVAGALITLATTGGTPVMMSDDAAGTNPSLTKLTDALGQKTIWVELDVYDLTVDSSATIRIDVTSSTIPIANVTGLPDTIPANSKSDYDALRDKRIRDNVGSGFAEWGKEYNVGVYEAINSGLWTAPTAPNLLVMGETGANESSGISRSISPITNINGVTQVIRGVNEVGGDTYAQSAILFPPAPDGTKTYDSSTGTVVTHADAATAFAAETATNKVITSRQDFAMIESFSESMATNDWWCPLGNTQYGATTWRGIALVNNFLPQGYSAFGEWDTATTGYGKQWSLMSDAEKLLAVGDSENNMYYDADVGEHIQDKYRVRVIEGLGDDWEGTSTQVNNAFSYCTYDLNAFVQPRGALTSQPDYNDGLGGNYYAGYYNNLFASEESGVFQGVNLDAGVAHNGQCFAIPIALVERLNQGAYHPVYNDMGTATLWINNGTVAAQNKWYDTLAKKPSSTADCFAIGTDVTVGNVAPFIYPGAGSISGTSAGAGRPTNDPFTFYDAIYAGQVKDLRVESNKVDEATLLSRESKRAKAGEIRGWESVPFTKVYVNTGSTFSEVSNASLGLTVLSTASIKVGDFGYTQGATGLYYRYVVTTIDSATQFSVLKVVPDGTRERLLNGNILHETMLTSKYESLPWQDIIGDPANIAATFPNGVCGQWIPDIPNNTLVQFNLSKKLNGVLGNLYFTSDNGVSWIADANVGASINQTTNSISAGWASTQVFLLSYPTKANPYEAANNSVVLGEIGNVFASQTNTENLGSALINGLLDKVCVGNTAHDLQDNIKAENFALDSTGLILTVANYEPKHTVISLLDGSSPAGKAFPLITQENQQYYLQWAYKEMIYDGTWGDDNKFTIINGASTEIDDNGNTIKIGQKRVALPNLTGRGA